MMNLMNIWVIKNTIKILEIFLTIIEKGKTKKTFSTDNGKIDIEVPREQLSTFEPKIVKNHERNISKIEDQILFLYSKGMSTIDIQETIYQMFYSDLDKDTISRITDKIIPEIVMWQQRPLDIIKGFKR